jgi:hypothetical protein
VTLAGLPAGLETATASAATCVNWSGIPADNSAVPDNVLNAASVLSPCSAWAVGWNSGSPNQNLIENWDGTQWTAVASPSPGTSDNVLNGVHAISPSNAWAVGSYNDGGGDRSLILHWDGNNWAKVASPSPGDAASLSGIDADSAGDAWAVGDYTIIAAGAPARADATGRDGAARSATSGSHTLTLHWNGTKWKQVASPTPGSGGGLTGVTATSAGNVWAVGDYTGTGGADLSMILHWNGTAWKRQASPVPGTASGLTGVDATSAGNAWAVGLFGNGTADQTLTLHWNGTRWAQVPSPDVPASANQLNAVAVASASSASNIWAVGDYAASPTSDLAFAIHCC